MTTYALRVVNKTKKDQDFFFFTAPPNVGTTTDPTVFTNTWVASTGSPNEPIDINTTLNFYGCEVRSFSCTSWGKTTVKQGVSTDLVTLGVKGGKGGSTYHTAYNKAKKHFEWDGSLGTTAEAGCFEIVAGNDFTSDDNLLIGMAMDDPSGETIPIPVACISADPGMNYNIAPVIRFYVSVGNAVTGDIIDYQEVSSTAGCYDFSPTGKGAGMFYGEIEYEADGTWSITQYKDSPPQNPDGLEVGDGWLQAAVAFAIPIIVASLKIAIKDAVKTALQGLKYQIGDLTFSSDGTSLTVNYKLPLAEEVIVKPFSEISVSLDAKSEILEIKFSPYLASPAAATVADMFGGPSQAVKTALSNAILGVKTIPKGETLTIT